MQTSLRSDGRRADELRPVTIERGFARHAAGSALYGAGNTRVLCTVSIVQGLPAWLEGSAHGWATGEYSMLPAATGSRHVREGRRGPPSGRSMEIQRIIGRSIRSVLDLAAFPGLTLYIDCDVVDADGSTRTAAITGSYVALCDAVAHGLEKEIFLRNPIKDQIAGVSVGLVDGAPLLDLTYEEDSRAQFDLNLAVSGRGGIVEIQGTAEGEPIRRGDLEALIELGCAGAQRLFEYQNTAGRL